jgi:putative aldouronate transport system permease protein
MIHSPNLSFIRRGGFWRRAYRARGLYFLLTLPVVYVFVFNYIPMYGVIIALKKYNVRKGIMGSPWCDPLFYNFQRFFSSPSSRSVIVNTLALSLQSLIAGFPLPILLAIGLNYSPSMKIKRTVQMVTFAPYFLSTVLIVGLMSLLFSVQSGIANVVIRALGGESLNFMGDAGLFRPMYVWSGVWQGMGYNSVIYISALSSVDPQMHEAAIIDGASVVKRIRYIDIPTILPTIVIMLILSMGGIFSSSFEKVYLMQNAQNLTTSQTIETYLYQVGISAGRPDYSFATAIGLFQNVVGVLMTLIVNYISKKLSGSGLF